MKQNKTEIIIEVATKHILDLEAKIYKRCLLEGCCYGYEYEDKAPRDHCIYCGAERNVISDDYLEVNAELINKEIRSTIKRIIKVNK